MGALQVAAILLRLLVQRRAALAAENLALRQQVAVLQRSVKRPKLRRRDRIFWAWLSRLWRGWRSSPLVVQPETVIRWHGAGRIGRISGAPARPVKRELVNPAGKWPKSGGFHHIVAEALEALRSMADGRSPGRTR